jgi:hypothetical protein
MKNPIIGKGVYIRFWVLGSGFWVLGYELQISWGQASVPAYKIVSFADSLFFKNGNKELFFIEAGTEACPHWFILISNF